MHIARAGLADESLPSQAFWLYRTGRSLLALKNEHAPTPTIVFFKQYANDETAAEAMSFLRNAKSEREPTDLGVNSSESVTDPAWLSIEKAFHCA
jgi:hypothetical protein